MISWFYGILLAILIGFMVIPFIPAVSEYFRRRDKGPRKILDSTIIEEPVDLEEESRMEDLPYIEQSRIDSRVKTIGDFIRVVGDVSVPAKTEVSTPLVIHGKLTLGDSCRINGTLKATGDLNLGKNCVIMGHCISGGNVLVDSDTRVEGIVDAVGDIILKENAYVGGASAEKSIRIAAGAVVGKKLSADELVIFEPEVSEPTKVAEVVEVEKAVPIGEERGERVSVQVDADVYDLDSKFSKGEIDLNGYLKKRKDIIDKRTSEIDVDFEILKLLGERKKVMEIALRLMLDPDEVKKRIDDLMKQELITSDFNLTEKGVERVFG
jgi:predicted acyltransferase (DUF342 family)